MGQLWAEGLRQGVVAAWMGLQEEQPWWQVLTQIINIYMYIWYIYICICVYIYILTLHPALQLLQGAPVGVGRNQA